MIGNFNHLSMTSSRSITSRVWTLGKTLLESWDGEQGECHQVPEKSGCWAWEGGEEVSSGSLIYSGDSKSQAAAATKQSTHPSCCWYSSSAVSLDLVAAGDHSTGSVERCHFGACTKLVPEGCCLACLLPSPHPPSLPPLHYCPVAPGCFQKTK